MAGGRLTAVPALILVSAVFLSGCGGDSDGPNGPADPVCEINVESLAFGSVSVGETSDLAFKITNTGGGTLAGNVSEGCADFSIVGDAGYSLAAGDTATITVRFAPASAGAKACTLDTGASQCPGLPCTGTGVATTPICQVSPASLNFFNIYIGHFYDRNFTITNVGGGTLSGEVSESCDEYSIVSGGGAYSLGASQSVTVTVRFTPTSVGTKTCDIATGASCAAVACTGVGDTEPVCELSVSELDFGTVFVGEHKDTTFTITNVGGGILVGEVYTGSGDFSVVGAYEFALGAGQEATFTIRFAPAIAGPAQAMIDMDTEFCGGVACTGVGESPPACEISPGSLDFGAVLVGGSADTTFTIRNAGGGTLSGKVSSASGEFLVLGSADYSLGAGESDTFTVRFAPLAAGAKSGYIETTSEECSDVSVTGVGAPEGDYYVHASTGSDGNPGTLAEPFKTITHAVAAAGTGATICVLPGTYDAALGETFPISLQLGQSLVGDVANKGAGADPTTIYGSGEAESPPGYYKAALIGAEGSSVAGFSIGATYSAQIVGIYLSDAAVSVSDNTFTSATTDLFAGVYATGIGSSVITRNDFLTLSYGAGISSSTGGVVVENNLFLTMSIPIDMTGEYTNAVIRGNTFVGTGLVGIQVQRGVPLIEGNTFNKPGGYADIGAIRCVRSNANPTVRGNLFICARGVVVGDAVAADIGSVSDPGGNDFSSVTGAAVYHTGAGSVSAIGNTWAVSPPVCGSDIVVTGSGTVIWGAGAGESCP